MPPDDDKDWTPAAVDDIRGGERTDADGFWCTRLADGHRFCIPWKLVHDDSEVYDTDQEGTLVIPQWLAEKKGLV